MNKNKIEKAIRKLDLSEQEVKVISYLNLKQISEITKLKIEDVMFYLRYERENC